jgi:hypothetical protein
MVSAAKHIVLVENGRVSRTCCSAGMVADVAGHGLIVDALCQIT